MMLATVKMHLFAVAVVCVGALVMVLPAMGEVHDVPNLEQEKDYDCGPTAAASCINWFQTSGNYPNLKTRDGKSDIGSVKKQLEKDSGTSSSTGTSAHKLRDAMNKLVDEGPNGTDGAHKKQLRAKVPKSSDNAYSDFGFLDSEFAHKEDIVLLITYVENGVEYEHYVTTRNLTGTGTTRSLEYMDPATGTTKTTTVTQSGGKLNVTYDGNPGKINGILTMSPDNTTESTVTRTDPNNPRGGATYTYTPYFPDHRKTKDMHIVVKDCDKSKYAVSGLPQGWQWDVKQVGDKCYLTFYKGTSPTAADLVSGSTTITVTYTGLHYISTKKYQKKIHHTTSGSSTPTDGALPAHSGYTVMSYDAPPLINGPERVACAIAAADPVAGLTAQLTWDPVGDPGLERYEVYDTNTDELVGVSLVPEYILVDLDPDIIHSFEVVARSIDDVVSEPSETVYLHLDTEEGPEIVVGGPQVLEYRTPLASCFRCPSDYIWTLNVPGATTAGQLYVTMLDEAYADIPSVGLGPRQSRMFYLSTDASLVPNPIMVSVPYDPAQAYGDDNDLRLFALQGGGWVDVTMGVNAGSHLIMGDLPELPTTLAIVSGLPGDFDDDFDVDLNDLMEFAAVIAGPGIDPGHPEADLDADGDCDLSDFVVFASYFTGI